MPPKKQLRTSQACDFCSRRAIRCRPSEEDATRCQNCVDFDVSCTYQRPMHKRGQKKRHPHAFSDGESSDALVRETQLVDYGDDNQQANLILAWTSFAQASAPTIHRLLDAFFDLIFPIFPMFHRSTLSERVAKQQHTTDRGLFASVMAACALVASRLRDGAPCEKWKGPYPSPEPFFVAARDALPADLSRSAASLDGARACALLALTSLQDGQVSRMHHYLGLFQTISSIDAMHEEEGQGILDPVAEEERRCVFWSMYTFEVFAGITWSRVIRSRERQSSIRYPSRIDAEHNDARTRDAPAQWLVGWTFTTDMYRILEHAVDFQRSPAPQAPTGLVIALAEQYAVRPNKDAIVQHLSRMYGELPSNLKEVPSGEAELSHVGFQAIHIQVTLALVQVVLFMSESDNTADKSCDVTAELLNVFKSMPLGYLKAIGAPMIYHVASIGPVLASVIESPVSDALYQKVQSLLLDMASLLESLEQGMQRGSGVSTKIRQVVENLDGHIREQTHRWPRQPIPLAKTHPDGVDHITSAGGPSSVYNHVLWDFPAELMEWPWQSMHSRSGDELPHTPSSTSNLPVK